MIALENVILCKHKLDGFLNADTNPRDSLTVRLNEVYRTLLVRESPGQGKLDHIEELYSSERDA
jgi:hypothetical protein